MAEKVPTAFLEVLVDLATWLEAVRAPAMIVGGVAASILGRPRATRDVDALAILSEDQWAEALGQAPVYGIIPRIEDPRGSHGERTEPCS